MMMGQVHDALSVFMGRWSQPVIQSFWYMVLDFFIKKWVPKSCAKSIHRHFQSIFRDMSAYEFASSINAGMMRLHLGPRSICYLHRETLQGKEISWPWQKKLDDSGQKKGPGIRGQPRIRVATNEWLQIVFYIGIIISRGGRQTETEQLEFELAASPTAAAIMMVTVQLPRQTAPVSSGLTWTWLGVGRALNLTRSWPAAPAAAAARPGARIFKFKVSSICLPKLESTPSWW
jgi:hypothetical protein